MIKISLLCPTRGRIKGIKRFLQSILDTAVHLEQLEILFAVDVDDVPTQQFFGIITHQQLYPKLNIKYFVRNRSEFTNNDYYNWLAKKSTGQYIWAVADDLVFLIEEWDKIIDSFITCYLSNKPDRIMCAGIRDNTPKPKPTLPNFPCFPLVTREAYDFFGFILHPEVPTWGADFLLYNLYIRAGRYLEIQDSVYLNHISWHTKQAVEDETAKRVRKIFGKMQHNPAHNIDRLNRDLIPLQVDKLKSYLRKLAQGNA